MRKQNFDLELNGIAAERALLMDARTGAVIWSRNPQARGPIASIQKLLAALLVVERGALDDLVEVTPESLQCQPSVANLVSGGRYARRALLTAMLVGSANDAALALARDHSADVDAFADAMTDRALTLGMKNSRFRNPNGLPADDQYSTAEDVGLLARYVDGIPLLRRIFSTPAFPLAHGDGSATVLRNTNRLLHETETCDGMKTGFTRVAGHCLVATGPLGGNRRIAIVLNSTRDSVWTDASQLLTAGEVCADAMAGASLASA